MVNTAKGILFKYTQGKHKKYFFYLPLVFSDDSMFPCKLELGQSVKVWLKIDGKTVRIEDVEKDE